MFSSSMTAGGRPKLSLSPSDLPPLPARMTELLQVANDPSISLGDLDRAICRDQSLTMRVLAVANSSYYGCSRRIESVRSAVALLGTRQVQNIASALSMAHAFEGDAGPSLWRHGLACALWTDKIVRRLGFPSLDSLFTTALLHDIGIVMLLARAGDRFAPCVADARANARPLAEAARAHIGWDHAELGAQLCRNWRLPERIAELIEGHERIPERNDLGQVVLAVADRLATALGMPEFDWTAVPELPGTLVAALGLGPGDLDGLVALREDVASETAIFA